MNTSLLLPVSDSSQAGEARRLAAAWTRERGCGPDLAGSVALVVTELAKNLALHTAGGVLLLRNVTTEGNCGIEILSLDSGPGVANFSECLRDGFSTAGTSGIGLGGVRRASQAFEVHSRPGVGTALLSQLSDKRSEILRGGFVCGAVSVPFPGEDACGDTWAVQYLRADRVRLIVGDGLGHGPVAATASRKAVGVFAEGGAYPLPVLLEMMHEALAGTRGAAVAIAEIDTSAGRVSYVGVGNIAAGIVQHDKTTSLVSHNGTVGAQIRKVQEFTYPWMPGATFVMHADGVKSHWKIDSYLGLAQRHPSLIAGVIYRDYLRTNDDATVVVLRARD